MGTLKRWQNRELGRIESDVESRRSEVVFAGGMVKCRMFGEGNEFAVRSNLKRRRLMALEVGTTVLGSLGTGTKARRWLESEGTRPVDLGHEGAFDFDGAPKATATWVRAWPCREGAEIKSKTRANRKKKAQRG